MYIYIRVTEKKKKKIILFTTGRRKKKKKIGIIVELDKTLRYQCSITNLTISGDFCLPPTGELFFYRRIFSSKFVFCFIHRPANRLLTNDKIPNRTSISSMPNFLTEIPIKSRATINIKITCIL